MWTSGKIFVLLKNNNNNNKRKSSALNQNAFKLIKRILKI